MAGNLNWNSRSLGATRLQIQRPAASCQTSHSEVKKNKMAQINVHITQPVPFFKFFLLLSLSSSIFYLVVIISPPWLFYFWIGHNLSSFTPLTLSTASFTYCMLFLFLSTFRIRKHYPVVYTPLKIPRKVSTIVRTQKYVIEAPCDTVSSSRQGCLWG